MCERQIESEFEVQEIIGGGFLPDFKLTAFEVTSPQPL